MEEKKDQITSAIPPTTGSSTTEGSTTPQTQLPTQQNPVQAPETLQQPKGTKSISFLILLLVLLLGLTIGGYYLYQNFLPTTETSNTTLSPTVQPTPTINPTADWETYENETYGYQISYPRSLSTQILSAGAGQQGVTTDTRSWYIYNPTVKESYLNRIISFESLQADPIYSNKFNKEQVTLDGKTVTKVTQTDADNKFDIYIISTPKGIVEIYASTLPDNEPLANHILSTFKFIDLKVRNPGWEIYRNEKYSFQFEYTPEGNIESERDSDTHTYIRIQNYQASDDEPGLGAGEYYLEVLIYDKSLNQKAYFSTCNEVVSNYKLLSGNIYRGESKDAGGDTGGVVKAMCVQKEDWAILFRGTENHPKTPIIESIFDTFQLIK